MIFSLYAIFGFVFNLVVLCLLAGMFFLYFSFSREKHSKEALTAKGIATFLTVISAGMGILMRGENPFSTAVFWFFVLCTAADILLDINFLSGMAVFLLAHAFMIWWLFSLYQPPWYSMLIGVLGYCSAAFAFRKEFKNMGKMLPAYMLYPVALCAEVALALPLPFVLSYSMLPVAVGAVSFFVSDMMVAKSVFSSVSEAYRKWTMVLYWGALFLFAVALW